MIASMTGKVNYSAAVKPWYMHRAALLYIFLPE